MEGGATVTTQSRRRALAVGVLVTGPFLAVLGGRPTPSAASVGLAFNGAAGAEGMRLQVIVPSAPASSNVFDAGGPIARASLTSAGDAQGFAAFP